MSAKIRVMIRVAKRRMESGESLDDILNAWTALTDDEKQQIRDALA